MTLSKLGTLFYNKYSIKTASLSQEIIKVHAKAILSSLGPEWKIAPIYSQLTEVASKSTSKNELQSQAMSTTEVKKRREASTIRKLPTGASAYGRRAIRRSEGDSTAEQHASKSLLPPYSGRRSGKEAGLRLASSPAVKRDTQDGESSDEDSSRPRKRRRPSPPEMGDNDSDVDIDIGSPPAILSNGNEPSSASSNQEDSTPSPPLSLNVTTIPLPSLSPTGPNGSWTCDRPSCSFVVRDAESSSGVEKIKVHYTEHAEKLEREALVVQEAKGRRLPVDHLLEKLRSLGESTRLGIGREVVEGREVAVRIKRERGLAV
jgi:hypothetical protein